MTSDKSDVRRRARAERREEAGRVIVEALCGIGHRFHDAADDAQGDAQITLDGVDYMSLRETAHVWHGRAARVRECGQLKAIPYECSNGHRWEVVPMGCGLRLCPHCEHLASGHVRKRVAFLLGAFKSMVRLLTLTMRNEDELEVMLEKLAAAFARLRKSRVWRRCVRGAVAVFECTASEDRGWHAHIHVAWDGLLMPWEEVLQAWTEATKGQGTRVDLRGSRWPKAAVVRYLSKYASKGVRVLDLPEDMVREFVQAWWRFRTLRTYGTLFRANPPEEPAREDRKRCPECGELGRPLVWVPNWRPKPPPPALALYPTMEPRKAPRRPRRRLRRITWHHRRG